MRKHLYLIVDREKNEDLIGSLKITDTRVQNMKKNEQRQNQLMNLDTGERYMETLVSIGYHDFDGEEDYEERIGDVIDTKLREIDESHLEDAGLDPEDVLG